MNRPRLTQRQAEAALAAVTAMLAGEEGVGDWPTDVSAAALEGAQRWLRARAVATIKAHTERVHAINWDRIFDLRCKSKRGDQLTDAELVLIKRAHAEDRERYAALDDRVFEATKPFGAKLS